MSDINKKADKTTAVGVLQIFAGGFLIILFGIIALISGVWSFFVDGASSLPMLLFLISIIVGGLVIRKGYVNYKLASRFRRVYRAMDEETNITLSELEKKLGWDRKKLEKALRRQTAQGFWEDAFLDTNNGIFALGYNPAYLKTDSGDQALDELLGAANDHINELSTISRSVENTDLKAQVDTLADISKQIYDYVGKNPEKSSVVRQLSNYLLPTTVSLLTTYLKLQNQAVKSENMLESMQKITDMMDTIIPAFKKQLSNLYSEKTMDVDVEIEVMQNMLGL